MAIDYSAFVAICRVKNTKNFGGFNIKTDGLYTIVPDDDEHPLQLSPTERAVLSWHPTGIHKTPALPLPCTLEELRSFVADAGLLGCIDEDAITAMMSEAGDTMEVQAAYDEAGLNGEAINWRYWVHQMPALNVMQAAYLMSALEPGIFATLNERPGKTDPAKYIDKAKKIQCLAEAQGKLTASPAEWVGWAQAQSLAVHTGFLLAVEEWPETTSVQGDVAPAAKVEVMTDAKKSNERPLLQQLFQEQEILRVIRELSHDPKKLQKREDGKPGIKANVRQALTFSPKVFDKAWERLRANQEIQDAE